MLGRLAVLGAAFLAACSFDPSGLTGSATDAATGDPDGASAAIDAPTGGGPDAPTGCADADGDTICDGQDRCAGHDDRQDADHDAVPDGCDDWPCGARPSVPLPASTGGPVDGRVTGFTMNLGDNLAVVSPGATIGWADTVTLRDGNNGCVDCNDQLEVGWADGGRFQCVDFGNPPQGQTQINGGGGALDAPATPGRHDIVMQVAQATSCTGNGGSRVNGWWLAAPAAPVVAVVCVR